MILILIRNKGVCHDVTYLNHKWLPSVNHRTWKVLGEGHSPHFLTALTANVSSKGIKDCLSCGTVAPFMTHIMNILTCNINGTVCDKQIRLH